MGWFAQHSAAIVAIATVIYTALTALIWFATQRNTSATRRVLESSHRPYLGVLMVEMVTKHSHYAQLCTVIQNIGSAPSRNVEIDFHVSINGAPLKDSTIANIALLPNQKHRLCCELGIEEIRRFRPPDEITASVEVRYQGMTKKKYRTETRCTYAHNDSQFSVVSALLE